MITNETRWELDKLMRNFNGCFINHNWELILVPKHNIYFSLEGIDTVGEVRRKVIAWVSRSAIKGVPQKTQKLIREKLNNYLGVDFDESDWDLIYTYLGNGCNGSLCEEFVESGYNIKLLEGIE